MKKGIAQPVIHTHDGQSTIYPSVRKAAKAVQLSPKQVIAACDNLFREDFQWADSAERERITGKWRECRQAKQSPEDPCALCRSYSGTTNKKGSGWCMRRRATVFSIDTCGEFRPIDNTPRRYERECREVTIYPQC